MSQHADADQTAAAVATDTARAAADRLDRVLVARGVFESRAQARAAIAAGRVRVAGRLITKASTLVAVEAALEAQAAHPWASRAGLKLAHGLRAFGVDPAGRVCLDVGAATGGFVDVLRAGGAARVYAVDVGRDQLAARLRADPGVVVLEQTDARKVTRALIPEAPALITCDASFIGLAKVLPAALRRAAADADLIALFKPQFEVGPAHVGKGGVVKDAAATARALEAARADLARLGWPVVATTASPVRGGDGNQETLLHARRAP